MTREQSIKYASAVQWLQPPGITVTAAVVAVKFTDCLPGLAAGARFYKAKPANHPQTRSLMLSPNYRR